MTEATLFQRGPAWGIAALLSMFTLINFVDKAALGMVVGEYPSVDLSAENRSGAGVMLF